MSSQPSPAHGQAQHPLVHWPHWRLLLAVLAASAGPLGALAAEDDARAQVEQRVRLAARLIGDVATGQRIQASGSVRAVAHLDEGRVHQALAEQALAAGDLATARRQAGEALQHVAQARRLVPDAPARQAASHKRYEQRLAGLERLLQAWPAAGPGDAPSPRGNDDRLAVISLLGQARGLAGEARFDDALPLLARAEGHLLAGMNQTLHQRTLDYTHRASTPAEAVQQALAQHESLLDLVPLALAELKPAPDAQALAERYADASRTLRQQAVQRQQRGESTQALADLNNAVLYAQRALAAAGVALPAPSP